MRPLAVALLLAAPFLAGADEKPGNHQPEPLTASASSSVSPLPAAATPASASAADASLHSHLGHAHSHESREFMCKVCGATLFNVEDHIPGMALSGPRVSKAVPEPQLGDQGTLWQLVRSGGSGSVTTALFHTATQSVMLGAHSEHPAFAGFTQRQAVCSRCGNPIGWRFDRVGTTGAAAGAGAGTASTKAATSSTSSTSEVKDPSQDTAASTAAASTASGPTSASSSVPLAVIPYDSESEDSVLSTIEGLCLTLPKGWWNFQWCHKGKVNQFHRDPDGKIGPDWSLGEWDNSGKVERTRPISAAAGYYTSHFFKGGQRCDETGKGRAAEVQFFCCAHVKTVAAPFIEDVDEPSLCKYRLRVCVPQLCQPVRAEGEEHHGAKGAATARPSSKGSTGAGMSPSPAPTTSAARDRAELQAQPQASTAGTTTAAGKEAALPPLPAPSGAPQADASASQPETVADNSNSQPSGSSSSSSGSAGKGVNSRPLPSRTPFPAPDKTYRPSTMPASFFAAAWSLLLGDSDGAYRAMAEGEMTTSVPPVRFG